MKVTLTIEVPDDFKKGDCNRCRYECYGVCDIKEILLLPTYTNCPLEIQETGEEVSCRQCYFYNSDGERCLECDDTYSLFMYPPDN